MWKTLKLIAALVLVLGLFACARHAPSYTPDWGVIADNMLNKDSFEWGASEQSVCNKIDPNDEGVLMPYGKEAGRTALLYHPDYNNVIVMGRGFIFQEGKLVAEYQIGTGITFGTYAPLYAELNKQVEKSGAHKLEEGQTGPNEKGISSDFTHWQREDSEVYISHVYSKGLSFIELKTVSMEFK